MATRPKDKNGLGLAIPEVLVEVEKIESLLMLLPDTPAVYAEWKRIIEDHNVSGVQVHDARSVAPMKTHGVINLLTFDVGDFSRYTGIEVTHPKAIAIKEPVAVCLKFARSYGNWPFKGVLNIGDA